MENSILSNCGKESGPFQKSWSPSNKTEAQIKLITDRVTNVETTVAPLFEKTDKELKRLEDVGKEAENKLKNMAEYSQKLSSDNESRINNLVSNVAEQLDQLTNNSNKSSEEFREFTRLIIL